MGGTHLRLLPPVLLILALVGRSDGAKLRVLMAQGEQSGQPNSQKQASPLSAPDPFLKNKPLDPIQNPVPPADPSNSMPTPESKSPPRPNSGKSHEKDKQDKTLLRGPENKAPQSEGSGEKDKHDRTLPSRQENKAPQGQESGGKDKMDKAPPSGSEPKPPPVPKDLDKDKQDKVPPTGMENKNTPGIDDKIKNKQEKVLPSGPNAMVPPSLDTGKNNKQNKASPGTPETKVSQGPEHREKDKQDKMPPSGPDTKGPQGPEGGGKDRQEKALPGGSENKGQEGPSGVDGKLDKTSKESNDQSSSPNDKVQEDTCKAVEESCDEAEWVACLHYSGDESQEPFLLVHNRGVDVLNVIITVPSSMKIDENMLELKQNKSKEIKFSTNALEVDDIVLNAGKKDCTLHTRPSISNWNLGQQLQAATHVTPMNGAYFLFFTLVLAGGTWACCKFGWKVRRTDNGVPYQQLEMGALHQSSLSDVGANIADGWDDGWGDDWDEEEVAPRPSEKRPTATVLSNGHTSRSPNKDGWDIDWDD